MTLRRPLCLALCLLALSAGAACGSSDTSDTPVIIDSPDAGTTGGGTTTGDGGTTGGGGAADAGGQGGGTAGGGGEVDAGGQGGGTAGGGGTEDAGPETREDVGTVVDPCSAAGSGADPDVTPPQPLQNVYVAGSLATRQVQVPAGGSGLPVDLLLVVPDGAGPFPVVVFQHGFVMANTYYSQLFAHIASHGYVVVAPQMYTFAPPSTTSEADSARVVWNWVGTGLAAAGGVAVDVSRVALVGHSRGAKVVWRGLEGFTPGACVQVRAIAALDPVDGTGGPFGGDTRVLEGGYAASVPVYVLGTGLGPQAAGIFGQSCAPDGDNHVQFYGQTTAPAIWHAVAPEYGHLDMLDDNPAGCFTCSSCAAGPTRAPLRTLAGGHLVGFLRGSLTGDPASYGVIEAVAGAPIQVTVEKR